MDYATLQTLAALPLLQLVEQAHQVHQQYWPEGRVQICTLLSIKTGGCSEDCAYCAQSARYTTGVQRQGLLPKHQVLERAMQARANGSTRFCMGAAWKGITARSPQFQEVIDIVRAVAALGLEVCVTLGKIGDEEARQLKAAGLTAYNHNLDTSPEYYPRIVTSHTYQDRLETIQALQHAGIGVCCGGIVGLGEGPQDRLRLLEIISSFTPAPESIPINALIPIHGTPLGKQNQGVEALDIIRMAALARLAVPTARVRLSAGRERLSDEAQALAFYAGANSLFYGEKLLTENNAPMERDKRMLEKLGLQPELPPAAQLAPLPPNATPYPDHEPHPCHACPQ